MFEGSNKITLSQSAMMKLVEEYINKNLCQQGHRIEVTNMSYDPVDWTTTFDFEKATCSKDLSNE